MVIQDDREFIYRIDGHDHIVFANQHWFDFARENGAMTLEPDSVIGTSIWEFISNDESRHVFEILLKQVREAGRTVTVPFRCDSPECRRFMHLQISRKAKQEVEFRGRILREERREMVHLLDPTIKRSDELLVMCGWCKKVKLPDGSWEEVEAVVKAMNLFDAPRLPRISHGICQPCASAFLADSGVMQSADKS